MPQRIDISRAEFEKQWGIEPYPDVLGMQFYSDSGVLLTEYVFTDDGVTVEWLEKLYKLE